MSYSTLAALRGRDRISAATHAIDGAACLTYLPDSADDRCPAAKLLQLDER